MYQLVVMDDREDAARAAAEAVAASPLGPFFSVTTVTGADELRRLLGRGAACDVLVADIALGEGAEENGIQVVRDLIGRGSATQVIYLTGYIEFCTEVYETEHVYFLTKPLCQEQFDKALARAVEGLERMAAETLPVKKGRAVESVPLHAVTYIESNLRKLEVHADGGVRIAYGTLSDILGRLPVGFIRSHKSFVVNLARVSRLEPDGFVLDTGERVPISKRCRREARRAFFAFLER